MMATGGFEVGALHSPRNLEQAVIVLQAPLATRVNLGNLLVMPVRSQTGAMVPLGELGRFVAKARRSGDLSQGSARRSNMSPPTWSADSARRFMACSMSTPR